MIFSMDLEELVSSYNKELENWETEDIFEEFGDKFLSEHDEIMSDLDLNKDNKVTLISYRLAHLIVARLLPEYESEEEDLNMSQEDVDLMFEAISVIDEIEKLFEEDEDDLSQLQTEI